MSDSKEGQRWLAYELHDRLMPWIHGARMLLSRLQVAEESAENLGTANHCLKIAAEEGRSLIGFLESLGQDSPFQLSSELEKFVELTRSLADAQQQKIVLKSENLPELLPAAQAWSVLRVIQQAVLNAVQHAGPCEIVIDSRISEAGWVLTVSDSGIGFELNDSKLPNHFGLTSMQQRAESLAAQLEIKSLPGKGTTIALHLPNKPIAA